VSDRDLPLFDRVRAVRPAPALRDRVLGLQTAAPPAAGPRLTPWLLGAACWLLLLAIANATLAGVARPEPPPPTPQAPRSLPDELAPLQQLCLRGQGPRHRVPSPTAWRALRQRPLLEL
jgi:hypothetical protein